MLAKMSPRRSLAIGGFAGSAGLVFVWVAMSLVSFRLFVAGTIASLVKAEQPGSGLTSTRQHGSEANGAAPPLEVAKTGSPADFTKKAGSVVAGVKNGDKRTGRAGAYTQEKHGGA